MTVMHALIAVVVVQVNVAALAYVSGTLMPLATGLLTHLDASSKLKAGLNLVLSIVAGVIAAFVAHNGTLDFGQIVTAVAQTYIASAATYVALWKPTGIAPSVNATGLALGAPPAPNGPIPALLEGPKTNAPAEER